VAAVPVPHTFVDGVYTSSEANTYLRDPLLFLMTPPSAQLRQIVAQNLTTSVGAAITFTTADWDTDYLGGTGHSNSVNTSRYTANYQGKYLVAGAVAFAASAAGRRLTWWAVNGVTVNASETAGPTTAASSCEVVARTMEVPLNVNDYVELWAQQESGGTIATNVTFVNASSHMTILRVGN